MSNIIDRLEEVQKEAFKEIAKMLEFLRSIHHESVGNYLEVIPSIVGVDIQVDTVEVEFPNSYSCGHDEYEGVDIPRRFFSMTRSEILSEWTEVEARRLEKEILKKEVEAEKKRVAKEENQRRQFKGLVKELGIDEIKRMINEETS